MRTTWLVSGLWLAATAACSDGGSSGGTGASAGSAGAGGTSVGGTSTGGAGAGGTGGTSTGGTGTGGAGAGGGACLAGDLLAGLGRDHVLVGASMEDGTASAHPFDARYLYLSGGLFDGNQPCASCATGCTSSGTSCANTAGCAWWGCWQWDQVPPGAYIRDFVAKAKADGQLPMITYYEILQTSGLPEGTGQVPAINDLALMRRFLADWSFLLDQVGNERALLHIEPDFWGYVEHSNPDPRAVPAQVATASNDCSGFENNASGLARCLISLVRRKAPNARVGLHGSAWGTQIDVLANSNASFDVAGEARKLGAFLVAAGAAEGDFVVVDASDRDAGWYATQGRDTWWDETNQTLPNFDQAFVWSRALAEAVGKPIVWWQVPVGNRGMPDQPKRWKDNRVDYLMTHLGQLAESHGAAVLFGAGDGDQTTPETDDGNLAARVTSYASARVAPCP